MPDKEPKYMNLKCVLTQTELLQQAENMGRLDNAREEKENEAKESASQYKNEIASIQTQFKKAATLVSNRYEYRNVEIREDMNTPDKGDKQIYRLDTGEYVDTKEMTQADYQYCLDLNQEEQQAEDEE